MSLDSTVISLVPFPISEEKPGLYPPRYHIDPSDMKTPSLLHVGTANHFVYLDESRGSLRVPDPSDQVARSIVEDYIEAQMSIDDVARPALFWVDRKVTAEQVLEEFKVDIVRYLLHQKKWFLNVAMLADNDWSRYHQHNVISTFQRRCADLIGWNPKEHEWMAPMTTMKSTACPYCGVSVPDRLAICTNGHIVNPKLHKEIEERLAKV
jgi:hypothetical protein